MKKRKEVKPIYQEMLDPNNVIIGDFIASTLDVPDQYSNEHQSKGIINSLDKAKQNLK